MPPTNYIWMKTDLKHNLIGIYEWLNGKWHPIELKDTYSTSETYSSEQIDLLLKATEEEIIRNLTEGNYTIKFDSELDISSKNAVENRIVTAAINSINDTKVDYADYISDEEIQQIINS